MESLSAVVIWREEELPVLPGGDFFHSRELFRAYARSPRTKPFMVVAYGPGGNVAGHLLGCVRLRLSFWPPFVFTQGRVYGAGGYADGADREEIFPRLLRAAIGAFRRRLCLWVEFSNMPRKMFGYKWLRAGGFFPVAWQEVYNSLHSMPPGGRLSAKAAERIDKAKARGVETAEVCGGDDMAALVRLLRASGRFTPRRVPPSAELLSELCATGRCRVFVSKFMGRVVGGCLCAYSGGDAHMWFFAARRKTLAPLYPGEAVVWRALCDAHARGCRHFRFLDAGLPYSAGRFRSFVLSFGGKPVAGYRWFRFAVPLVGRVADALTRS